MAGLGAGFDFLMQANSVDTSAKKTLRIGELETNREQPRKSFDEESIHLLAESIKQFGILQPILVRPLPLGGYQIVAGERRYRAAILAELSDVPVVIRDLSDSEVAQIALIENLQRENLNPIEEALGFQRLQSEFGMTQDQLSKTLGKSRTVITNALRLLKLPVEIRDMISNGSLSSTAGRALLGIKDFSLMIDTAQKYAEGKISVRKIESIAKNSTSSLPKSPSFTPYNRENIGDTYFAEMELSLHERLGRKVKIDSHHNKGKLVIEFFDRDDLSALVEGLLHND